MKSNVREMALDETRLMIRYFLEADLKFLNGMGVDPQKLPSAAEWYGSLKEDFARPITEKDFYYLVWEVDGAPTGHCNINKIAFGEHAYMHLHVWNERNRKSGNASQRVRQSMIHFFEVFDLRELFCEPYALNPAPNRTLPKVGFQLIKTYETTPGWIAFHQPVNLWRIDRATALSSHGG